MRYFWLLIIIIGIIGCKKDVELKKPDEISIQKVNQESQYIGQIGDSLSIRLLILKHCPDSIANVDAKQAIQAVDIAASKGLTIENIGNYHINKEGRTQESIAVSQEISLDDLEGLKRFISEQMKVGAKPGDTLIVYTIGHGGGDGSLMRLGQRGKLMYALAAAAEENDQEVFWWQLSCHAAAELPKISDLNEAQQNLFSMVASSTAHELSYFTTQGKQMEITFSALAEKDSAIDPDKDNIITAGELRQFMISKFGQKRGSLVYAKSDDEPIFGFYGLFNQIPIIDRNNPQGNYKNYIPIPRSR